MNHMGISGQETMTLSRNALEMNKNMHLRLRLDMHSPVNVELHSLTMLTEKCDNECMCLAKYI